MMIRYDDGVNEGDDGDDDDDHHDHDHRQHHHQMMPYPLAKGQSVININASSQVLTALMGGEGEEPDHLYLVKFVVFSNLFVLVTNYIFTKFTISSI